MTHRESYLKNEKDIVSKGKKIADGENPVITEEYREILVMQARKAQIMDRLSDDLKLIDMKSGKIRGQGQINRDVLYDEKKGVFFVDCDGKLGYATLGDLIADAVVGCEYNFSLENIPREVAKQYVVGRARAHLNQLFNRQLALQEEKEALKKDHQTRAQHFRNAYNEMEEKDQDKERAAGKLFEQSIIHLIKELQYDLPDMDIEVQEANIIQDMDEKIDFIVRVNKHHRGGYVEESQNLSYNEHEKPELFGIQFTMDTREETQKHKEEQIARSKKHGTRILVDDIVLITVPMSCKDVIEAYHKWRAQGCPPGGPARLYPAEVRARIVEKVLEKIGNKKDEEKRRGKIEKYFKMKS